MIPTKAPAQKVKVVTFKIDGQDVSAREFPIATLRTRLANICSAGNNHWWKNEALTATEIDCFQFRVAQEAVNVDYEIVNAVFL